MSGITMSYRLEPRRNRPRCPPTPIKTKRTDLQRGERTARLLALAHHVERLVDDGVLADYATAARKLGITSARMTQVMNLLQLSPEVQSRLIASTFHTHERRLRAVLLHVEWNEQLAAIGPGS